MSSGSADLVWAALLIVVVPVTVVVFGEMAERLRQRESPLAPAVATVRAVVLPLAVLYLAIRVLLGLDSVSPIGRLVASALVVGAAVALVIVIRVVVAAVKHRAQADRRGSPPQLLLALPRVLLVLVALWLLLSVVWGVEISGALTALGVTSLVISLALQQPLGSLASGLLLLSDQPFRPGEWIRVGDLEGRVIDVNWRTTRIENRDGDLLIFPNSYLAGATLVNYDQPSRHHRVILPVQVAFSNPPSRVIEMLLSAAVRTPGVLADPAPDVKVVEVDDPLMSYEVQVWVDDHARTPQIRSDLAALVWYWSERLEVPLPSPAQDLFLWDGPTVAADKLVAPAELRRRLVASPMIGSLPDEDLDLLAAGSRHQLFAAGETIVDVDEGDGDEPLRVLYAGRAALVVEVAEQDRQLVSEFNPGELFGLLRSEGLGEASVRVVALVDCQVLVVDGATAGIVIGRTPALADSLHDVAAARQRRLARLITGPEVGAAPDAPHTVPRHELNGGGPGVDAGTSPPPARTPETPETT
jgi:small-conductance mechanosensitive channel/CRP-like cAMP-binding protein